MTTETKTSRPAVARIGRGNSRESRIEVRIRPFVPADYAAVVDIANRSLPEYGDTKDEWRFWDERRAPKIKFQRFVGESAGRVVAWAQYDQHESTYHPRKFGLELGVDPDLRRRGIGSQMYAHLRTVVAAHDPIMLYAFSREDFADSVSFIVHRGYHEVMRAWESRLDLQAFDAAPYVDHLARLEASGVRIVPMTELPSWPDRDRRLYEVVDTVARDVPSPDPHTSVGFDVWVERSLHSPKLLPDTWMLALDGDRLVGTSNMWTSKHDPTILDTGLTGVVREYRRRGIALALKVRAIERARELGYAVTRTWNETGNEGMLSINVRLGFVRQPAWVTYAKDLASE